MNIWKHIKFNDETLKNKEIECSFVVAEIKKEHRNLGSDIDAWQEFIFRVGNEVGITMTASFLNENTLEIKEQS